jgi:hypothetical protein
VGLAEVVGGEHGGVRGGLVRCASCGNPFFDGDLVLPLLMYVANETRGDFVGSTPTAYAHAYHLNPARSDG